MATNKRDYAFSLDASFVKELEAHGARLGIGGIDRVIARALATFEALAEYVEDGNRVAIIRKGELIVEAWIDVAGWNDEWKDESN